MTWTLRRAAAVTLLAILGLVLAAPAAEAAEPRSDAAVSQTFAKLTDWNALAAHLLAWFGLGDGTPLGLQRIAAPTAGHIDPDGGPAKNAVWPSAPEDKTSVGSLTPDC